MCDGEYPGPTNESALVFSNQRPVLTHPRLAAGCWLLNTKALNDVSAARCGSSARGPFGLGAVGLRPSTPPRMHVRSLGGFAAPRGPLRAATPCLRHLPSASLRRICSGPGGKAPRRVAARLRGIWRGRNTGSRHLPSNPLAPRRVAFRASLRLVPRPRRALRASHRRLNCRPAFFAPFRPGAHTRNLMTNH